MGEGVIKLDVDAVGDQRVFLSAVPPSLTDWIITSVVALLSLIGFCVLAPIAKVQLAVVPAFIPAYESALLICDIITAVLLFGQVGLLRTKALLILAGGYLFSGLMAIPHGLTFPGVFAPTGLLGAGPQTTSWLYISWHIIFPIIIIFYGLSTQREVLKEWSTRLAITATSLASMGGVILISGIAIFLEPWLPPILSGLHYTTTAIYSLSLCGITSVAALIILAFRRPYTLLNLWMMVVMIAWTFDVGLSAAFNNGRFDVGFYAGRIFVMLGGSFVLCVMLAETARLYSRLTSAARRVTDYAGTLEAGVQSRTLELRKTNEALIQAQKMEAIGNLTGGLAHDFNNMLGIIIGSLDTALLTAKDETADLIHDAIDGAISASELTKRLLAFARQQPLRPERIQINTLVTDFVGLLRRLIGENVRISINLGLDVWPIIVDKTQLESSLTNLAANARDAMPRGGKLLITTDNRTLDSDYASMYVEVTPGDYVVIEVTDNGTGMTPEVVHHIFEPFFTTKEPGKGTGLGLSMVFGFIKQSNGHISVYSEPGVGTTFRLYFPRTASAEEEIVQVKNDRVVKGQGEVILVVEDNERFRRVVLSQLKTLGYETIEAENAEIALDILDHTNKKIDLLFTDIVMPGSIDGIGLAKHAAEKFPDIKVLMTSGFPGGVNLEEKLDGVSVRLLSKPYRTAELSAMLRTVFDED